MKIDDLMSTPAYGIRPEDDVQHARKTMLQRRVSKLPVVDDQERLIGMLTKSDLLFSADHRQPWERRFPPVDRSVGEVMTRRPYAVTASMNVNAALREFLHRRITGAPVVEELNNEKSRVIGMFSVTDALEHIGENLGRHATVQKILTPEVATVDRHTALPQIVDLMLEKKVHQIFVTESNVDTHVERSEEPRTEEMNREFDHGESGPVPGRQNPEAAEAGVVGVVTRSNLLFGNAMELALQKPGGQGGVGKDVTETRKLEPGGRKMARHVVDVNGVAEDVMSTGLHVIHPDQGADAAANILRTHRFNALPVIDGGELVGVVTRRDLLEGYQEYVIRAS